MKAILFDLDGVFYQGEIAIPGAALTARWVIEKDIPHLFVTNTTSRPRSTLLEKLRTFGIETDIDHIFTPLVACKQWLKANRLNKLALYIPEISQMELSDFEQDLETPEAIVIGDLGELWNYQRLNTIFRLLMQQKPPELIALGMTRYWQAEDGLRLDVAPFIKALEYASGRTAQVMGKPSKNFFDSALNVIGVNAEDALMVGDDIRSDIEAAQQAGLTTMLVKTGKFRQSDMSLAIKPDYLVESVRDLINIW